MKSYSEIMSDISNILTETYPDVNGTQLDILVGILSAYAYEIQSSSVSLLLENDINTAININSLLTKAAQFGVSIPRVVNPEVELEVKSISTTYNISPGDELFSISKYKFLYVGYYTEDGILNETSVTLLASEVTKVRCIISTDVSDRTFTDTQDLSQTIYKSEVPSRLFVRRVTDDAIVPLRVHNTYIDYISDVLDNNKIYAVTYVDYSVKLIDEFNIGGHRYTVILPTSITSVNDIIPLLGNKIATSYVTISEFRSDGKTKNIELFLGRNKMQKSELVNYININIKSSQLIKSNSDILAYFSNLITKVYGKSVNINYEFINSGNLRDLNIYLADDLIDVDKVNELIVSSGIANKVFISISEIQVSLGNPVTVEVSLSLNNSITKEVQNTIESYVTSYDYLFETVIDEYDLISKINSIDEYLKLTEFNIRYNKNGEYISSNELTKSDYLVTKVVWK